MKITHFFHRSLFGPAAAVVSILLLLFSLGRGVGLAAAACLPGLVGHWQFEEGAGTTIADSSGNGLTGTLGGNGAFVSNPLGDSLGNYSVDFIPNSEVALGTPGPLQITGAITLTAWVNVRAGSVANSGRIMAKGGGSGQRGWALVTEGNGTWSFQIGINPGSGNTSLACFGGTVIFDEWVHVAGVYNPTSLTMQLYTNGVLVRELTSADGVLGTQENRLATPAYIGRRANGLNFDGLIDEVRVFNRALTVEEILALPEVATTAMTLALQPASQSVPECSPVTFTSLACGSPPHTYQWSSNGVDILGATSPNYTIPVTRGYMNTWTFRVTAANNFSSATSDAVLTVQPNTPPTLVSAGSVDGNSIAVCFSEVMDPNTVVNINNYQVNNGAVSLQSPVVLRADGKSVVLTPTSPILGPFTVKIVGSIRDLCFAAVPLNSTASGNIAGLAQADLNSPTTSGSIFSCKDGDLDVTAGGADIGGTSDQGYVALKSVPGDFDVQVRVNGLTPANTAPKAGLMARETDAPDSPTLHVLAGPSAIEARRRATAGGDTASWGTTFTGGVMPNVWVRLRRTSDLFTSFYSVNGTDWVIMGKVVQAFPSPLLVGLAATAHNDSAPAVLAEFRGYGNTVFQNATLMITQQPTPVSAPQNSTVNFSALAGGTGAPATELVYQWQRETGNMSGTFTNIVGENNSTLTVFARPEANGLRYRVRVHLAGLVVDSTPALLTLTPDMTLPTIQSVSASGDGRHVTVVFSEEVEFFTATEPFNYAIASVTPIAGTVVVVASASLGADGRTVTLYNALLAENTVYRLTVNGVKDLGVPANTIAPNSQAQFLYNSLVAWWQFEEGDGTTTADSSGHGHSGTLLNSPEWVPALFGAYALNFTGARVDFGNPPALHITGALTLAAWVNTDSLADNGRIVTKGDGPGLRGWSLNLEGNDVWAFSIATDGGNNNISVNAPTIPIGSWTHVAGVYDPGDPEDFPARDPSMRFYTNGVLGGELTDSVPTAQFDQALNVSVGARPNNTTFFDGRIDEVRIHVRALSGLEIAVLARPKFFSPTRTADVIHLDWGGAGQLEAAPAVNGPWTAIPDAIPPYDYQVPSGENRFFRLSFTP